MNTFLKDTKNTGDSLRRHRLMTEGTGNIKDSKENSFASRGVERPTSPLTQSALDVKKENRSEFRTGSANIINNLTVAANKGTLKPPMSPPVKTAKSHLPKSFVKPPGKSPIVSLHLSPMLRRPETLSARSMFSPGTTTASKTRIPIKPPVPVFTKKPAGVKGVEKSEQLLAAKVEQLEMENRGLDSDKQKRDREIQMLRKSLKQLTEEKGFLEQQQYQYIAESLMRDINTRVMRDIDREIEDQLRDIVNAGSQKSKDIRELTLECTRKEEQMLQLTLQNESMSTQSLRLTTQLSASQAHNLILSQALADKEEETNDLRNNIEVKTEEWGTERKDLEKELKCSWQHSIQLQKQVDALRGAMEEERGRGFETNQHLMTMITETDDKSEKEIILLRSRVCQLQSHLREYQEHLQAMEGDLDRQDKEKAVFEKARDRQMDALEELVARLKEEGVQFLKARDNHRE